MNKVEDDTDAAASGSSNEMKGLVAAAAMMAGGGEDTDKKPKSNNDDENVAKTTAASTATTTNPSPTPHANGKTKDVSAARTRRLEQNRRAAIESRRRKKVMIGEIQRSVTFYTKANENLKMDNCELEQRLFLAKQRVMQMEMGTAPADLKAPPEEYIERSKSKDESNPSLESSQNHERQPIAPVASAPFPPLRPSVSPMEADQAQAQLTATQALYETRGYPSAAARVAANTFSQFVGITGNTPSITDANNTSMNLEDIKVETKPSASESIAAQLPSEEEVGSDKYVESLHQFAMQQAAAANAAAAAANAAIQAMNWHNMMKANGMNPQSMPYAPPVSMMPLTATSAPMHSVLKEKEEGPPIKKQKL